MQEIYSSDHTNNHLDHLHFRTEHLLQLVKRCNELHNVNSDVIGLIRKAMTLITETIGQNSSGYKAPRQKKDKKGRPSFLITKSQMEMYLLNNFSVPKISKLICVSKATVKRRLKQFELSVQQTYSNIGKQVLDNIIAELISKHPNCGYRRMIGFLLSKSIKISEKRVRESMHRVDPEGVLLRALQINIVNRREYKVPGVLSLWHMDGHHKLIRYYFVLSFFCRYKLVT